MTKISKHGIGYKYHCFFVEKYLCKFENILSFIKLIYHVRLGDSMIISLLWLITTPTTTLARAETPRKNRLKCEELCYRYNSAQELRNGQFVSRAKYIPLHKAH